MDTTFDNLSTISIELSDEQLSDVDGGMWPVILLIWAVGVATGSCAKGCF